jgi:hypothetical protein
MTALQITRRRRKLSVPVMFPNSLDAHALLGAATTINGDKAAYDLTGILVHNGTAMGGELSWLCDHRKF